MLNAEIMFVALFGTANYFARLAYYFIPFQALAIPWLLKFFDRRGRKSMMFITVLGYSLYFIYSQAVHESFDSCYYGITLWDYLSELLEGVLYK
jgi:type IV secretory pathway protease TraF